MRQKRAKTSGIFKEVSKGSGTAVQAATPTVVIDGTATDLEDKLLDVPTLIGKPFAPDVLADLREVTPTLGVHFRRSHKEFYNTNVAEMTQLGTLASRRPHGRRTRVWVGGMNAVSQLSDRTSALANQFSGKRALLIWCGGRKPLNTSDRKEWLEPEEVRVGYWADKWYSFPVNLAITSLRGTEMFEDLVDKVRSYVDAPPEIGDGFDDSVQAVLFACQQGANRPLTAEAAHVETDVAHNMAGKVNSCNMGQNSYVK